jgi:hypothetical protein
MVGIQSVEVGLERALPELYEVRCPQQPVTLSQEPSDRNRTQEPRPRNRRQQARVRLLVGEGPVLVSVQAHVLAPTSPRQRLPNTYTRDFLKPL